jgi:hypothetical protein
MLIQKLQMVLMNAALEKSYARQDAEQAFQGQGWPLEGVRLFLGVEN